MINIAVHLGLELTGSCTWACLRGQCQHRHHRLIGDFIVCLIFAILTVRLVG